MVLQQGFVGIRVRARADLPARGLVRAARTPAPRERVRGGLREARTGVGAGERPWVVVLAGGEGRRLRDHTRGPDGAPVPKQYFRFRDERTQLRVTVDRAARVAPRERIVVLVLEDHRTWWERELADLPADNVLSQPAGRGTGVAILHALEHVRRRDRGARVVLMPSDHDVEDEDVLLDTLGTATRSSTRYPAEVVLLGIVPTSSDAEYGLIVPHAGDRGPLPRVRAFVEKPAAELGAELIRRGALWNSFILVSSARLLLGLYERTAPLLVGMYRRGFLQARDGGAALRRLFARLPERDFSRHLLERSTARLRLAPVPECGWTDLGTPARLALWLEQHREARYLLERRFAPPRDAGY